MNATEVRTVIDTALRDPANFPWLQWLLALVVLVVAICISIYMTEKAKNAATKEDIREITQKIESVRHEYQDRIERLKGTIQMRTVALSQRLAAHQAAYSRWAALVQAAYEGKSTASAEEEAHQWWIDNSLYLAPAARKAFKEALEAAMMHRLLKDTPTDPSVLNENSDMLHSAGKAIIEGVELPEIDDYGFVRSVRPEHSPKTIA